jgi:hypothetical protein
MPSTLTFTRIVEAVNGGEARDTAGRVKTDTGYALEQRRGVVRCGPSLGELVSAERGGGEGLLFGGCGRHDNDFGLRGSVVG